jgi:type IV pilus assembly protein PilV
MTAICGARTGMRGFSLLEVLITMALSALALLGAAMLTIHAMKFNHSGRYRTQAVVLSSDIAERIEANKDGATAGSYALPAGTTVTSTKNCAVNACTATELAVNDLSQWAAMVAAALPGGTSQIAQSVAGNPTTYQIVVSWVDRRDGVAGSGAAATENFSYTTNKTVFQ